MSIGLLTDFAVYQVNGLHASRGECQRLDEAVKCGRNSCSGSTQPLQPLLASVALLCCLQPRVL